MEEWTKNWKPNTTQREKWKKRRRNIISPFFSRVGISSLVILNICSQNQANDVFIAKFGSNPGVKIYQLLILTPYNMESFKSSKKKHVVQKAIIQTLYEIKGKEEQKHFK